MLDFRYFKKPRTTEETTADENYMRFLRRYITIQDLVKAFPEHPCIKKQASRWWYWGVLPNKSWVAKFRAKWEQPKNE